MKMKTLAKVIGGATLVVSAASAQAYNLPFPSGNFLLSDNSAESLINCDPTASGCESTAGDTTVDIGDRLAGIFVIDDISGTSILTGSGYDELTGVFDAVVVDKVVSGIQTYYKFAPSAEFEALYGTGSMLAWYVDPTHEYLRETTTGQSIVDLTDLVTNGDLLWVSGITSADNYWYGRSELTDDVGFPGVAANTDVGDYAFALDLITNNSGLAFASVDCSTPLSFPFTGAVANASVDQCGIGNILTPAPAGGSTTPFDVWNDQNITMNRVPEPATLSLLALGLLGAGVVSRKSRKGA